MNKRELVEALLAGKDVRRATTGAKVIFDPDAEGGPFIYVSTNGETEKMLSSTWDALENFHITTTWQENIGKGKLCWVWREDEVNLRRHARLITSYRSGWYLTYNGGQWSNAEPLTPEELKEYSI